MLLKKLAPGVEPLANAIFNSANRALPLFLNTHLRESGLHGIGRRKEEDAWSARARPSPSGRMDSSVLKTARGTAKWIRTMYRAEHTGWPTFAKDLSFMLNSPTCTIIDTIRDTLNQFLARVSFLGDSFLNLAFNQGIDSTRIGSNFECHLLLT